MREIKHAREIAEALGGIPELGRVCGVQYRLAYGYVDRNSIPAHHDVKLVAALSAAGSDIDLLSIARWRAGLAANDKGNQASPQGEPSQNATGGCGDCGEDAA